MNQMHHSDIMQSLLQETVDRIENIKYTLTHNQDLSTDDNFRLHKELHALEDTIENRKEEKK